MLPYLSASKDSHVSSYVVFFFVKAAKNSFLIFLLQILELDFTFFILQINQDAPISMMIGSILCVQK